jgi:DNA-binding transcriptional regulator YiaG
MQNTSTRKSKGRVNLDPELSRRIKGLRDSFPMNQRQFAQELRAVQTQISAWERGWERPSTEKLIALGNIAKNSADRIWFWQRAGCDEDKMRDTLAEDVQARLVTLPPEMLIKVPLVEKLAAGSERELVKTSKQSLSLPINLLGAAPSVFCFKLAQDFPANVLLSAGDIVLIDQSPIDPRKYFGSPIMLFFERRPEYEGIPLSEQDLSEHFRKAKHVTQEEMAREDEALRRLDPEAFAEQKASDQRAHERASKRTEEYIACPQIRVGWLEFRSAGEPLWPEGPSDELSQLVLVQFPLVTAKTGERVALTGWLKGIDPWQADLVALLKPTDHIIGRVVGWIRQGSPLAAKAAEL